MTAKKTLDARRAERLASRDAQRREDAELDSPVLAAIAEVAASMIVESAKLTDLLSDLVVTQNAGGLSLATQIQNVAAALTNVVVVTDSLTAEAQQALVSKEA